MSETEKEDQWAQFEREQTRDALTRVRNGISNPNREKLWRDVFTNALLTSHSDPSYLADRAVMSYDLRGFK